MNLLLGAELPEIFVKRKSKFLLLIDFSAAFSSVSHLYLWRLMSSIGLDSRFINAVKALFVDITHQYLFRNRFMPHVDVHSGIKQGDPISPLLFLYCIDPIIDFINRVDSKDVNKLQLEGLTKAGVFDEFDKNRSKKGGVPPAI